MRNAPCCPTVPLYLLYVPQLAQCVLLLASHLGVTTRFEQGVSLKVYKERQGFHVKRQYDAFCLWSFA